MYVPKQGDIVWLNFDPSAGREIMKKRPAYVLSREEFNEHTGLAIVAPITSTIRGTNLEVKLSGTKTKGAILVQQMRSLDYESLFAEFIERTPEKVTAQVRSIAQILVR
jgi:mRNA-degrading endonuclease toxin of MazEF toxin-antitoxin module